MSYKVNEIFYSLQGEGLHTGEPAIFIRFSGCNLACPWCDTDHKAFTEMTAEQITSKCKHYPAQLVVLTGGEPALQADDALIAALHDAGYYIAIETNGTHSLPDDIDWVTCSPKEGSHVVLSEADEIKIVYTGQDVEHWREQLLSEHYLLQPCSCQNTKQVVDYVLSHPWWRLSLQTHKILDIK